MCMEKQITTRRAEESDLKTVQDFGYKLLEFERQNWDSSLDPNWPYSETAAKKYLEAIKSDYVVFPEIDGKPVGFLIGKVIETPADDARHIKRARLENIYIDEEARNAGVGAKTFEVFRNYCKQEGVSRMDVSVLADNDSAVDFYKKMNFRPRSINLSQDIEDE